MSFPLGIAAVPQFLLLPFRSVAVASARFSIPSRSFSPAAIPPQRRTSAFRFPEFAVVRRSGESLVELIVALVVLEVIGSAALAAALTVEQLNRRATQGAAVDMTRWLTYRVAESAGSCVTAPSPDTIPLLFAATAERPQFTAMIRCGR
jgi:hypothetical protein